MCTVSLMQHHPVVFTTGFQMEEDITLLTMLMEYHDRAILVFVCLSVQHTIIVAIIQVYGGYLLVKYQITMEI